MSLHPCCKNYSAGNNLSDDYPYANTTNFTSCSHSSVNSISCMSSVDNTLCPFYTPDTGLYSKYSFSFQDKQYEYTVNKTRTMESYVVFDILDSDSNVISTLNYPCSLYNMINKEEFNSELQSIVYDVHAKIHHSEEYSVSNETFSEIESSSSDNSYILSLIK
jgi:hypothetical protein